VYSPPDTEDISCAGPNTPAPVKFVEQKMFYSIAYSEQNTHVTTDWTNSC